MNRISYAKRKEMFGVLQKIVNFSELNLVLDVGVTADKQHSESNFFEQFFPNPDKITALSNQDAKFLETLALTGLVADQDKTKVSPAAERTEGNKNSMGRNFFIRKEIFFARKLSAKKHLAICL